MLKVAADQDHQASWRFITLIASIAVSVMHLCIVSVCLSVPSWTSRTAAAVAAARQSSRRPAFVSREPCELDTLFRPISMLTPLENSRVASENGPADPDSG